MKLLRLRELELTVSSTNLWQPYTVTSGSNPIFGGKLLFILDDTCSWSIGVVALSCYTLPTGQSYLDAGHKSWGYGSGGRPLR